jgi:hypothetical protein
MPKSLQQKQNDFDNKIVNFNSSTNETTPDAIGQPKPSKSTGNEEDLRSAYPFRAEKDANFTLEGYKWTHKSINYPIDNQFDNIPRMEIEEFQPDISINTAKIAGDIVGASLNAASGSGGNNVKAATSGVAGLAKGVVKDVALSYGFQGIADSFTSESFASKDELNKQVEMYSKLFSGRFLKYYQVPYYDEDYFEFGKDSSWSSKGIAGDKGLGGDVAKTMSLNVPDVPTWSLSSTFGKLNSEFHLINDNPNDLERNFKFLNVFSSGAMWMQLGWFQKSPNVYRVTVPGRKMFFFASMEIECKYIGKLRRNPQTSATLKAAGYQNAGDILFPEAYLVNVTFDSLTPNNFNTAMYFNSRSYEKAPQGVSQSAFTSEISNVADGAKQIIGGAAAGAERAVGDAGRVFQSVTGGTP